MILEKTRWHWKNSRRWLDFGHILNIALLLAKVFFGLTPLTVKNLEGALGQGILRETPLTVKMASEHCLHRCSPPPSESVPHLYIVCMAEHLHLDQSSSRHRWCFTCHKPWSWRWWRGWRRRGSRGPRPARVFLMGTSQWLHCWWGKHCYTSNVSFPKTCSHRLRTPTVWQINLACSSECLLSGLWSVHRIGFLSRNLTTHS